MLTYEKAWKAEYGPELDVYASISLPSLLNKIWRSYYMKPRTLALLPPQGFEHTVLQSATGHAWCYDLERKHRLTDVRTARKNGEVCIAGHRVDIYGKTPSGEIVAGDYMGCYWHRHEECMIPGLGTREYWTPMQLKRSRQDAMTMRHMRMCASGRTAYPKFTYVVERECQFMWRQTHDSDLKARIANYLKAFEFCNAISPSAPNQRLYAPLRPRDAMFGGRLAMRSGVCSECSPNGTPGCLQDGGVQILGHSGSHGPEWAQNRHVGFCLHVPGN